MKRLRRYRVDASVTVYVETTEGSSAAAHRALEVLKQHAGYSVRAKQVTAIRYPMPIGALRWKRGLLATRWAEHRALNVGQGRGSWWITDGHVMLATTAQAQPARGGRVMIDGAIDAVLDPVMKRRMRKVKEWIDSAEPGAVRAKWWKPGVGVNRRFVTLVESSMPVTWFATGGLDAIVAKDSEGQLVALVMPMTVKVEGD